MSISRFIGTAVAGTIIAGIGYGAFKAISATKTMLHCANSVIAVQAQMKELATRAKATASETGEDWTGYFHIEVMAQFNKLIHPQTDGFTYISTRKRVTALIEEFISKDKAANTDSQETAGTAEQE